MNARLLFQELKTSIVATLVLGFILCGIYPFAVWGAAQLLFPHEANGSLIIRDGKIIGSSLIGQAFSEARYFHPRPSAAGSDGYDAARSGGSNLGPLSQKLMDQVKERIEAYRSENHLDPGARAPADAVTASGSGLDPHISVENAEIQASRVAQTRGMPADEVMKLVRRHTEDPRFGLLGEAGVNVLSLNLALDALTGESDARRQSP